MRNAVTTFAEIIGAVAIVAGIAMFSVPFAFISGGVLVIAGSYLAATR
jgi:hypothetical protein